MTQVILSIYLNFYTSTMYKFGYFYCQNNVHSFYMGFLLKFKFHIKNAALFFTLEQKYYYL